MEKYTNILKEIQGVFPHSQDIVITVYTDEKDVDRFSKELKEFVQEKGLCIIGNEKFDETQRVTNFTTPYGKIILDYGNR